MATVRIHSHDTAAQSYARILHASLNICNPSTFCVFPAMAAYGISYIVASEQLYPFIEELPDIYDNIHVAHVEFLNMAQIDTFRTDGLDLVTAITQWARGNDESSSISSPSPITTVELCAWMEKPSRIEMIQEEFIVLTNVCLNNGEKVQGPYEVFFLVVTTQWRTKA